MKYYIVLLLFFYFPDSFCHDILVVTDLSRYNDYEYKEKHQAITDAINKLNAKYESINFNRIEITNEKTLSEYKNEISKKISNKTILILDVDNSSTFATIYPAYPGNIAIISSIGTTDLLVKSNLNIFTTSSTSIEKSSEVEWLIKLNNYRNIYFDIEPKDNYGNEVVKNLTTTSAQIKNGIDCNTSLVITKKTTTEFDYRKNRCDIYWHVGTETPINYKGRIYSSSSRIPGVRTSQAPSGYTAMFNSIYERIMVALKDCNLNQSTSRIRSDIILNLRKTNIDNPYIGTYIAVFDRIKKSNAYYNRYIESGYFKKYITRIDNYINLAESQTLNKKNSSAPTLYLNFNLKNFSVDGIQSKKVYIEGFLSLYTTDSDISINDISIPLVDEKAISSTLIKSEEIHSGRLTFKNKLYKIKLSLDIDSDLFEFPFDRQNIELYFEPSNFSKKPFFIQPFSNMDQQEPLGNNNWALTEIYHISHNNNIGILPNKSITRKTELISIPAVGFNIEIERKHGLSTLLKFLGPVILILLLVFVAFFSLKEDKFSEKINILVSGLLAIVSIYFIFTMTINIEQFVLVDGIFVMTILINIALLSIVLLKQNASFCNLTTMLLYKIGYMLKCKL